MPIIHIGDKTFERYDEMIETTRLRRPDPNWQYTDPEDHEHHWIGESLPSAVVVKDSPIYYDGDEIPQSHFECLLCRSVINPGYTSDDTRQYRLGLPRYLINGKSVDVKVFEQEFEQAVREQSGS